MLVLTSSPWGPQGSNICSTGIDRLCDCWYIIRQRTTTDNFIIFLFLWTCCCQSSEQNKIIQPCSSRGSQESESREEGGGEIIDNKTIAITFRGDISLIFISYNNFLRLIIVFINILIKKQIFFRNETPPGCSFLTEQ